MGKKAVLNQIYTLVHMLLVVALVGGTTLISTILAEKVETDGSGWLPSDVYQPHRLFFVLGLLVFFAGYVLIWDHLLLKDVRRNHALNPWLHALFGVWGVLGVLGMTLITVAALIWRFSLFSKMTGGVDILLWILPVAFAILYPIGAFLWGRFIAPKYGAGKKGQDKA